MLKSFKTLMQIKDIPRKLLFSISYFIYVASKRKIILFPPLTVLLYKYKFLCRSKTTDYWHVSKYFEPKTTNLLLKIKGDTFIDIGAHIGRYTILLSKNFKRIIAIEPVKDSFNVLRKNILLNRLKNVKVINFAIGEKERITKIYINKENLGASSLIEKSKNCTEQKVKMISLDKLIKSLKIKKIDVIKIDVEGYELNVLKGAKKLLKKFRPLIIIEIRKKHKKKIEKILEDKYVIKKIENHNFLLIPKKSKV